MLAAVLFAAFAFGLLVSSFGCFNCFGCLLVW